MSPRKKVRGDFPPKISTFFIGSGQLEFENFQSDNLEFEIPELITPEFVRNEIAQGRAVIPANKNHNTLIFLKKLCSVW